MRQTLLRTLVLGFLLAPAVAGAVTEEDFKVKTTQNLLNLCTVPGDDPRAEQAIHFCEGYLVGAYHYSVAETAGDEQERLVCFPNPAPTRDEAVTMFIQWAQVHPEYMNELPVETEFRFLTEKWPCKK